MAHEFKKRSSISLKLSCMIGIAMFFIALAITVVVSATINSISKEEEINNIMTIANGKAEEIGAWLGGTNSMLKAYAETSEIKSDDWDTIQPLLEKAYNRINDQRYLFLAYVQDGGKGWTSKGKWLDARPLPYYPPIIERNADFFITNPFTGATTNEPLIIIGHGVKDEKGKNYGIMIAGIEGKSISSIAQKINIGGVGYGVIVDNGGVFVAHPDIDKVMKLNVKEMDSQGYTGMTDIASDMLSGVQNIRMYTENGKKNYMVYTPIPNSPSWTLAITVPESYFNRLTINIMKRVAPLTILVIAIILFVSIVFIRTISNPLKFTASALKGIASGDGDLTVKLSVKHTDEVAEISYYFNKTIEKIASTLKIVSENSNNVGGMSKALVESVNAEKLSINQIKDLINGLHGEIDNQHTEISEAANSIEKMTSTINMLGDAISSQTDNINTSSSAIEQMIANIDSVTQILTKNQDLINLMEKKTRSVKDSISNSVRLANDISTESNSLIEASSIIKKIAGQTNLLAMNAAIEAAHAGESGKGFAVVADEIRKLAEESSSQSQNITTALESLKKKIVAIASDTEKVEKDFMESFELTTSVRQQESVIMQAMQEQSAGGKQVISAVSDISDSTASVKSGSSEIISESKVVLEQMKTLTNISNSIGTDIQNISENVDGFENAVSNINDMANETQDKVRTLQSAIGKFTIDN